MAQQSNGIPLIETYWNLVNKADRKFSKIRDLPLYERSRSEFVHSKGKLGENLASRKPRTPATWWFELVCNKLGIRAVGSGGPMGGSTQSQRLDAVESEIAALKVIVADYFATVTTSLQQFKERILKHQEERERFRAEVIAQFERISPKNKEKENEGLYAAGERPQVQGGAPIGGERVKKFETLEKTRVKSRANIGATVDKFRGWENDSQAAMVGSVQAWDVGDSAGGGGLTLIFTKYSKSTELWKFQQENRQSLVEGGLRRWEIGEIASRIAQLYFGQYMRTSEANYLSESYIFYEAIWTREYFKEGLFQNLNHANKQLRFLARFITVCLLKNRRHMVHQLVDHLKTFVGECKQTFQEVNFQEWKLVVQEIFKFLKADTTFLNMRPLSYSVIFDPHPDTLQHVSSQNPKRNLRLRDAVLSSYHPNEAKFSELTFDTYIMLQSLEWEPSGTFYHSEEIVGQNGSTKTSDSDYIPEIFDPTLPPNPRKAVMYRPSVTHFIAVLATACDELPSDGVLLVYLSGKSGAESSSSGAVSRLCPESNAKTLQNLSALHITTMTDTNDHSSGKEKEVSSNNYTDCIHIGSRDNEGSNFIYPSDLLPFTRRPLFIVIDSEASRSFKNISGSEKGEAAVMLLSPVSSPPTSAGEWSSHMNGSLFTLFLTAPLHAFCLLLGFSGSDVRTDVYKKAEKVLSSAFKDWGLALATLGTLDPVWSQVFCDPFLRRLLLRFIFCRAVLALYDSTHGKPEFFPECIPLLPDCVHPKLPAVQSKILQVATVFDTASSFIFSKNVVHHKSSQTKRP